MSSTMTKGSTGGAGEGPPRGSLQGLSTRSALVWGAVALVGAVCWGVLAIARGETISALWLLFAELCSYAIAYRFYARFIAYKALRVDDRRATPAETITASRFKYAVATPPADRMTIHPESLGMSSARLACIDRFLADPEVCHVDLHTARQGCFLARAVRA